MNYKIILQLIILLNFSFSNPYKPLDIDFLKNHQKLPSVKKNLQKKSEKKKNELQIKN